MTASDKRPSRKRSAPKAPKLAKPREIVVGDHVLCGSSRASMPGGWFLGVVLWAGKGDFLIERATINGETWREVIHLSDVRAVGTIVELVQIQATARDAVRDLSRAEHEATEVLGRARSAVWAKVDALADGGLAVIPPDFAAIERHGESIMAVVGQADTERHLAWLLAGVPEPSEDEVSAAVYAHLSGRLNGLLIDFDEMAPWMRAGMLEDMRLALHAASMVRAVSEARAA